MLPLEKCFECSWTLVKLRIKRWVNSRVKHLRSKVWWNVLRLKISTNMFSSSLNGGGVAQLVVALSLMLKSIGFDPGWGKQIFVATLNISELHHPKCGSNMINNFGEIVSSLLIADHTCRRSQDERWEGLLLLWSRSKFRSQYAIRSHSEIIWFSPTATTLFSRPPDSFSTRLQDKERFR